MAKKSAQPKPKPVAAKAAPGVKDGAKINSTEEAKRLVKKDYAHIKAVDFIVLSNGYVYFGGATDSGRAHARRNDLKTFDVKL